MSLPPHPPPHSHQPHPLSDDDGVYLQQPKQPVHVAMSPKKLSPPRELCDDRLLEFNESTEVSGLV